MSAITKRGMKAGGKIRHTLESGNDRRHSGENTKAGGEQMKEREVADGTQLACSLREFLLCLLELRYMTSSRCPLLAFLFREGSNTSSKTCYRLRPLSDTPLPSFTNSGCLAGEYPTMFGVPSGMLLSPGPSPVLGTPSSSWTTPASPSVLDPLWPRAITYTPVNVVVHPYRNMTI